MKTIELKEDLKKELEQHNSFFKTMSTNEWMEYSKKN